MRRRTLYKEQGGSSEPVNPSYSAYCDICFYDGNEDKLIIVAHDDWSVSRYPASRYTPIGLVVVPGTHDVYGTGQCGVMSLREMNYNTPDEGSTSYQYMDWGYNSLLIGTAYNTCVATGTEVSPTIDASGTSATSYMPSDNLSGTQCPTDPLSFYQSSTNSLSAAPSPYLEDGSRNPVYYQTESPSSSANCLSDFDGVGNSEAILDHVTVSGWQTNETITNSYSSGNYPSACCCWRFHTEGTKQGDWYLPACGELGYMIVRLKTINDTINNLINAYGSDVGVSVSTYNNYWSSSEYSSSNARGIGPSNGYVYYYTKISTSYVRAFVRV